MPATTTMASAVHATMPSHAVRPSSCFCSGDLVRVTDCKRPAILPTSVCHSGGRHDHLCRTPRHRGVLEQHVGPVAERRVRGDEVRALGDRRTLSRQRRLLGLEVRRPQRCARRRRRCRRPRPRPDLRARRQSPGLRATFRSRITFACGICISASASTLARAVQLLTSSEHDVQGDQKSDDRRRRELRDQEAHDRDDDEHDVHRVAQLLQRHLPHGRRRFLLERVRAVAAQSRCRFLGGQTTVEVPAQPLRDVRRRQGVPGVRLALRHGCGRDCGRHTGIVTSRPLPFNHSKRVIEGARRLPP